MRDLSATMRSLIILFILQIRVSFETIVINKDQDSFWISLGMALQRNYEIKAIKSAAEFLTLFAQNAWEGPKVVILFDEFDKLHEASDEVRNQCLETLREIRQNK